MVVSFSVEIFWVNNDYLLYSVKEVMDQVIQSAITSLFLTEFHKFATVNPLYTDTRYNDKIRYNGNLTGTNPSLKS